MTGGGTIEIERDVAAPMRDGVLLRADVWRAADGRARPAIVYRAPYDKRMLTALDVLPPYLAAEAGYAVVLQDTRGRFASEGEWEPVLWEQEGRDTYDTVEWVAEQPWCDGNVGMAGPSYLGLVQLLGAMEQPPHLRAIAPAMVTSAEHDRAATGGALRLDHIVSWLVFMSADWLARRLAAGDPPPPETIAAIAGYAESPRSAMEVLPLRDILKLEGFPFSFADVLPGGRLDLRPTIRTEAIRIPTLMVTGWYDVFCGPTIALHRQLVAESGSAGRHRLIVGPWAHLGTLLSVQGELNFGLRAAASYGGLPAKHLAFFDRHLRGGAIESSPVEYFLMGANEWRTATEWPPAATTEQSWYLHSDGNAEVAGRGRLARKRPAYDQTPDRYTYDPASPVPSHGGRVLNLGGLVGGPLAQNHLESRRDVLSYTSPALEEPVDIAGPVRLCLWVDSTAPDTDFVGKLLDVRPDGRAIIIADGALRVRHREGFDTEKPLHPREAAEIVVDLGHVCARIATGHRIRVHISSSNFPHLDRNANSGAPVGTDETLSTARQRVHHKGARASGLTLTVLSGD